MKKLHPFASAWIRLVLVTVVLVPLAATAARAEIHMDVNRGKIEPMPVAIPAFGAAQPGDQQMGQDVAQVVSADLERSGLFQPLDPFVNMNIEDIASEVLIGLYLSQCHSWVLSRSKFNHRWRVSQ